MQNSWIIFTTISALGSVGFNFISRKILKDGHDSTAYSWWFEFFRFLIFLPFTVGSLYLIYSPLNFALFIIIGLGEFLAIYNYMKMHSHAELSTSSLIMQLRLFFVPLLAMVLLNERLLLHSYIGILLIFIGQIIALTNKNIRINDFINSAVKYSLISCFIVSVNNIVQKYASHMFNPQLITLAMATPSLVLFPMLMKDPLKRIPHLGRLKWKNILLGAIFNAFTMVFLILAIKIGPVGKVTALQQSILMLQMLLGYLYLNERNNIINKLAGAVIVVIGIILLV